MGIVFTSFNVAMFFYVLLLLSSLESYSMAGRIIPSSVPSTMRPLSEDYVKMKPIAINKGKAIFHGKDLKDCMPKGYRHASAPSRFVNLYPLGRCSPNLGDRRIP